MKHGTQQFELGRIGPEAWPNLKRRAVKTQYMGEDKEPLVLFTKLP